jgi:hypothetical protein
MDEPMDLSSSLRDVAELSLAHKPQLSRTKWRSGNLAWLFSSLTFVGGVSLKRVSNSHATSSSAVTHFTIAAASCSTTPTDVLDRSNVTSPGRTGNSTCDTDNAAEKSHPLRHRDVGYLGQEANDRIGFTTTSSEVHDEGMIAVVVARADVWVVSS